MKKIYGIAVALLGGFLLGLAVRSGPETKIKIEEKIVYRDRLTVKDFMLQKNDRTTIIETANDGSSRTTIIDRGETARDLALEKDSEALAERRLEKTLRGGPEYSMGVSVQKPMAGFLTAVPEYEVEFGRRLIGSAWITGSFERKGAGVGLRLEF